MGPPQVEKAGECAPGERCATCWEMGHGFWQCKAACKYCGQTDHWHRPCPKMPEEYPQVKDTGTKRQEVVLKRVEKELSRKQATFAQVHAQVLGLRAMHNAAQEGHMKPASARGSNDKAALRTLRVKEWVEVIPQDIFNDPERFGRATLAMNQQARGELSLYERTDGDLQAVLQHRGMWVPEDFTFNTDTGLLTLKEGRYVFD